MALATSATEVALKAKLFRGFADPSRLSIVEGLRDGPRAVGELVEATGLSQSNVSNHLGCLKDCGLVTCERHGRSVVYSLSDTRVVAVLDLAEELLSSAAQGVRDCKDYRAVEVRGHA
jgi:DNA-binding transcriptional ArsR family regulator